MESGISKSATLKMKRGITSKSEGTQLPNDQFKKKKLKKEWNRNT